MIGLGGLSSLGKLLPGLALFSGGIGLYQMAKVEAAKEEHRRKVDAAAQRTRVLWTTERAGAVRLLVFSRSERRAFARHGRGRRESLRFPVALACASDLDARLLRAETDKGLRWSVRHIPDPLSGLMRPLDVAYHAGPFQQDMHMDGDRFLGRFRDWDQIGWHVVGAMLFGEPWGCAEA